MDAYEATRIVFSRIQSLDPENATKIMGLLLIQDHGEKEMIRLAFGPEALVHSVVLKARKELGLSSNTPSTPSTPSSPSPFLSRQNSSSSRMLSSNGPNLPPTLTTMASSSWTPSSAFSDIQASDDLISPNSASASASYAAAPSANMVAASSSSSVYSTSLTSPFYGYGSDVPVDEFQLQDQLSFLSDASSTLGSKTAADLFYPQPEAVASPNGGTGGDAALFPSYAAAAAGATSWGTTIDGHHRRSCSVNDICFGSEAGSGYGWKPCLYFARGYCKNGSSCRFLHGLPDSSPVVADATAIGSPNKLDRLDVVEQCQELLRCKSTQQRLVNSSQLMASASFPYGTATAGKCMNFLLQQQQQQQQQQNDTAQRTAAGLMLGEDIHKLGRSRLERNDFSTTGGGMVNPGSRQIYLTFPADSTFREEDVSNYFSIYGPVQDVRIPYQQKRMFGFVTFVYPETVKLILAKGNPHFVCDARVLVKPYKEKGKVPDKYRKQQQSERGEFSACSIPTGVDIRDAYDLQLGPRMFYDAQDMLLRRKLEDHADLRQALELQGRKLMGLQLLDVKKYHHHHHHHHHSLSTGAQVASPTQNHVNQTFVLPSERGSPEASEEKCANAETTIYGAADRHLRQAANSDEESTGEDEIGNGKEKRPNQEDSNFQDGVEHNLPDSPFASPTKFGEPTCVASTTSDAALDSESGAAIASSCNSKLITTSLLPATSTLDVASFKSCFFQMPRFPSGHGAIGM